MEQGVEVTVIIFVFFVLVIFTSLIEVIFFHG